jgi:hypothetical protein
MIKWIYISRDRPTVKILYEIWYVNASTTELRVVCTEQVHSLTSFEVILTGVIWHSVSLNLYLEQVIVTNLVKNFYGTRRFIMMIINAAVGSFLEPV